jgi:hypothetical protein
MRRGMMRRIAVAGALATAIAAPASAQSTEFTFTGLAWKSRAEDVRGVLERKGYTFVKVDEDGDYSFTGTLVGQKAQLLALMADGRLAKFVVFLATPDEVARSTYADLRETLVEKYGRPTETIERYEAPYRKGDGHEDEAVKGKKGELRTFWLREAKPGPAYLSIGVTDNLAVRVVYESPDWVREAERRQAKQKGEF